MDDKLLFGDEAAERDPLLRDCAVTTHGVTEKKPILTGRWGTGKTALLLLQNSPLSDTLRALDPDLAREWYLHETSLDFTSILALQTSLLNVNGNHTERATFLRAAETVWKADILRVFRSILSLLWTHYGEPSGAHWDFVLDTARGEASGTSLWSQLPTILPTMLNQSSTDKHDTELSVLLTRDAYRHLKKCLRDVADKTPFPTVAIEPIETPTTGLETGGAGLAQSLITALLNVYVKYFAPAPDNPFRVRISIPWHRFDSDALDFPQKLFEHLGRIQWHKEDLRKLVNRRIAWEFKRVGRPAANDPWTELFPSEIPNGVCDPIVNEESFNYFVRHTHHRPRDILRLMRTTIEVQAEEDGVTPEEILKNRKSPLRIATIKENFRRVGMLATKELLSEAGRRFPEITALAQRLSGLAQPFTTDELKKRIDGIDIGILRAAEILWESGVIGVTAVPSDPETSRAITAAFTNDARLQYRNRDGQQLERWTWFEYNWEGDVTDLLARLEQPHLRLESVGMVFHPKTFEYFAPHNREKKCPIGV